MNEKGALYAFAADRLDQPVHRRPTFPCELNAVDSFLYCAIGAAASADAQRGAPLPLARPAAADQDRASAAAPPKNVHPLNSGGHRLTVSTWDQRYCAGGGCPARHFLKLPCSAVSNRVCQPCGTPDWALWELGEPATVIYKNLSGY